MKTATVRKVALAVAALSLAALFAACGGDDSTAPTNGPFTGTIQVKNDFFSPASVSIKTGTTVTWQWSGSSHSVTEGTPGSAHAFDSGVKSTGTFAQTFNTAGTVHYFCTVHGSAMSGTITVTP